MKPSNFKTAFKERLYIRCINKETKEFVDIPLIPNSDGMFREFVLNNISILSKPGAFEEPILKECHYYAIYNTELDENTKDEWVYNGRMHGFFGLKVDKKLYCTLHVYLDTNEVFVRNDEHYLADLCKKLGVKDIYEYLSINTIC